MPLDPLEGKKIFVAASRLEKTVYSQAQKLSYDPGVQCKIMTNVSNYDTSDQLMTPPGAPSG